MMLIKICGITDPETASGCLAAGADMVGLVYYPPSLRHVEPAQMNEILDAVESLNGQSVLVAVDSLPDRELLARFTFIQPYGNVQTDIPQQRICVVKDFDTFTQLLDSATVSHLPFSPSYYALEMSVGTLPGGNGATWDWHLAKPFCKRFKTLIAGGVTPENVGKIIRIAHPCGIDVSSGVESQPSIKDIDKVKSLIDNVHKEIREVRRQE